MTFTINKTTFTYVGKDRFGGDMYRTDIWKHADIKLDPMKHQVRSK
jgi:hypothetical protein